MLTLFLILMTILVGLWVLTPLFAPAAPESQPHPASGSLPELYLAKERAYDSIRDLEFDYHSGKLSETDYLELKARLENEAVQALRNLESQEGRQPSAPGPGSEGE